MSLALLVDEGFKRHQTGYGHPERPQRCDAVMKAVAGRLEGARRLSPRRADLEDIELCHGADYIEKVKREIEAGAHQLSTGDTAVGKESFEVALEAVGGCLEAADAVMRGDALHAFCAVRPPGHHARPNQGMGFCVFNNAAIAVRYAQRRYGAERVLIADWDVHHGNGTQDIFYSDKSVFFFSTHQSPWYPGTGKADETGEGEGEGATMNRPFPSGAGRDEILGAFLGDLRSAAKRFRPDLVMISAGFDSRLGDPLGEFRLTDDDFADLTETMIEIAEISAGGRLISVLEGGYDLKGLEAGVRAHIGKL